MTHHIGKFFLLILIYMCSLTLQAHAAAKPNTLPLPAHSIINVKDHGATGDGVTDDTQAIQKAAHAFYEQYRRAGQAVRTWHHAGGHHGVTYHAHPQIVFPEGVYRITEPIVFRRYANVRGVGEAVIMQDNPQADTFYFHSNWQTRIDNLTFRGGRTQLHVYTANNGGSQVAIDNCSFEDASGFAIEHRSFTTQRLDGDKWVRSRPWQPYTIEWEDWKPILTANDNRDLGRWLNSTVFSVAHSSFNNCMAVANVHADMVVIRDSQVTTHPQSDGPMFHLDNGSIRLYRVQGTAVEPAKGKTPYWIESRALLAVRESRFEIQGQKGIDFLRSSKPTGSWGWFGVILDQCQIDVGNSPNEALIWLTEGLHPNLLSITNVTERSGQPVQAVTWENPQALEDIRSLPHAHGSANLNRLFSVYLADNSSNIDVTLPKALEPYQAKAVPSSALAQSHVAELDWEYRDLQARTSQLIDATHVGQSDSDDVTKQLQAALDQAAQRPGSLVMFPGRKLVLTDTLRVPADVVIDAAGVAVLIQEDPDKDIFHLEHPQQVGLAGLVMQGGRRSLNVVLKEDAAARIGLDNCWLSDAHDVGLYVTTATGQPAPQAAIRFQRGQVVTTRGMVSLAGQVMFDETWMINSPHLHEQAFIDNLGGSLRLQAVLTNPTVWKGKRGKTPAKAPDWNRGDNLRWVDNHGQFYSLDTRYGGESGGICNVFNRSPKGTVYVEGGITRSLNGQTQPAIVYMEHDPAVTVLRHISGVPVRADGLARILRPQREGSPTIFTQGVMVPAADLD